MAFGKFNRESRKRRAAQLKKVAFELGMEYEPVESYGMQRLLSDFHLCKHGMKKRILNLMQMRDGWQKTDARVFDYYYTVNTGNSSATFKTTVFFVQSKSLGLPQFLMKPENFFHHIASFLGFEDIDFEEHEQFSEQYYLKGPDESLIRHTFSKDVCRFFTVHKDWSLEGIGYYLIFYKKHKLLDPGQIKSFYRKGMHLLDLLEKTTKPL